jgi:hypothetical protein
MKRPISKQRDKATNETRIRAERSTLDVADEQPALEMLESRFLLALTIKNAPPAPQAIAATDTTVSVSADRGDTATAGRGETDDAEVASSKSAQTSAEREDATPSSPQAPIVEKSTAGGDGGDSNEAESDAAVSTPVRSSPPSSNFSETEISDSAPIVAANPTISPASGTPTNSSNRPSPSGEIDAGQVEDDLAASASIKAATGSNASAAEFTAPAIGDTRWIPLSVAKKPSHIPSNLFSNTPIADFAWKAVIHTANSISSTIQGRVGSTLSHLFQQIVPSAASAQTIFRIAHLSDPMRLLSDSLAAFVNESSALGDVTQVTNHKRAWLITLAVLAIDVAVLTYPFRKRTFPPQAFP